MTSISLLSCLVICSTIWSSPRVTIVMREALGSCVSATVRLSMLKPRPEKRPATRARTPNLFSTRTEIVCFVVIVATPQMRIIFLREAPAGTMG